MGKTPDITIGEQSESLLEQYILTEDTIRQSRLSSGIRETLLVEDEEPQASVGSRYLFLLT